MGGKLLPPHNLPYGKAELDLLPSGRAPDIYRSIPKRTGTLADGAPIERKIKLTKAFTIYWTPDGWTAIGEGNPIRAAGGTGYNGKVESGSRVYVTNILKGQLRLLGAFTVKEVVVKAEQGKPAVATWDAAEYLISEDGSSTPLLIRPVPTELATTLRFITRTGEAATIALNEDGTVNGQAMRAVRELTPESAASLEGLLQSKPEADWTEAELRASVAAYLDMARRFRDGQSVVKKQIYRDLSSQIGRSEKSCEYRMQNISHVLALMGRDWIPGLPPAKNVGVRIAGQIEALIGELEGRQESPRAAEAVAVAKIRRTLKERPDGSKTPERTTSTTTGFVRNAQVKAWVLERANGTCEACDQPAPFIGADGFPFLEVHHLRKLADDGSDTVTNAVAVCPNCHRRLHFSENARAYRETLYGKIAELECE